mmetsp:Transcript_15420/g.42465  ORF Transcript_15420/g.42465 Transcript_15420/m.42465 type:complete len:669 (-) Transcript_15420:119-2125(-)
MIKPVQQVALIKPVQQEALIKPVQREALIKPVQREALIKPVRRCPDWQQQMAEPFLAKLEGVWSVYYPRNKGLLTYSISESGEVTVNKRHLQLVLACSYDDDTQDWNYCSPGTFYLRDAHRKGTWEYLWLEGGRLQAHHFGVEFRTSAGPFGSPYFFGTGEGTRVLEAGSTDVAALIQPCQPQKRQRLTITGRWQPQDVDFSAFQGTWSVEYSRNRGDFHYTISASGVVVVRGAGDTDPGQLVPAGSVADARKDPNYVGTLFLNNAHRAGTWEYIWVEDEKLTIHHFGLEFTSAKSPRGSSYFFGTGWGTREEPQEGDEPTEGETNSGPKLVKFVKSAEPEDESAVQGVWKGDYPELLSRPLSQDAEPDLEVEKLEGLYGIGMGLVLGMGHSLGEGLNGRPDALPTCLRASRQHSTGRGLGFSSGSRQPPTNVWPPKCIDCKERRWPAWQSQKGRRHCGFCHRPSQGKPRCHSCGTLTWDGLHAPETHDNEWWCATCWCADPDLGSEDWEAWFAERRLEYTDAFEGGGPELLPKNELPKDADENGEEDASDGAFADFKGTWCVWYPRNNGQMVYSISASGIVTVGSKKNKRRLRLVLAGSSEDQKFDGNYPEACFLDSAHREGTWEYLWLEGGRLHVHHFAQEHGEDSLSPTGSPFFFGVGVGDWQKG